MPRATVLLTVVIVAVIVTNIVGCVCTADWCETFRDAANSSVQAGTTSIAAGLINGVFAVINTGSDAAGTTSQTTSFTQGDPNTT